MRRKDRELTDMNDIIEVMNSGKIVQVAFIDGTEPYIVTLNYGYCRENEKIRLYFHSAHEGRKITCIRNNPNVCFSISICDPFIESDNACNYGMKYRSIVGYGKMRIVDDDRERIEGLNLLMKQYTGKDRWDYDEGMMKKTTVTCLEVRQISGKQKG